jgi:hypothetical protein
MAEFRYYGMTLTNPNYVHENINGRLNSGNSCHSSVQSNLSFQLLSKMQSVRCTKL